MTREDESVELHLDDAFMRFKQSCADVTRTIQAARSSGPLTIRSEPPKEIKNIKDIAAPSAPRARPRAASKQRSRESRSLLPLAWSVGR
jgi:hypothetical protein